MTTINGFRDDYFFLSNFYMAPFPYKGVVVKSGEHAFQATKTVDIQERLSILAAETPGMAKRLGRRCTLRSNWDAYKDLVMLDVVRAKFEGDHGLAKRLVDTGDATLIEDNDWGDRYWGKVNGSGLNKLGEILMIVRESLVESKTYS